MVVSSTTMTVEVLVPYSAQLYQEALKMTHGILYENFYAIETYKNFHVFQHEDAQASSHVGIKRHCRTGRS
jgi:hypothetical protein